MKTTKFTIWFSNGDYDAQMVIVHALSEEQARILAQAERIKAGCDYTICNINGTMTETKTRKQFKDIRIGQHFDLYGIRYQKINTKQAMWLARNVAVSCDANNEVEPK